MTITDIELRVDPEFESKIPPLTFDQWPQLVSNEDFRRQVTATLQDLKNYISQIEGGKRYEWDYEARKIV